MGPGGAPAVIWISDDDDGGSSSSSGPDEDDSVLLVEPSAPDSVCDRQPAAAADEDGEVLVTFCRRAEVLPHARHDCPARAFQRTECEAAQPVGSNADTCPQCFCYVCDKPVPECPYWTAPAQCHCNAHSRSQYWKAERGRALGGILVTFNLEPSEMDAHLRHGGQRLQHFLPELSAAYSRYLNGATPPSPPHGRQCPDIQPAPRAPVYRYSEVFRLAHSFVSEAEQEHPKASAVMLLGVFRELAQHKDPSMAYPRACPNNGILESLKLAVPALMDRITQHLQRLLVLGGLAQPLCEKLAQFFRSVPLPPHCYSFSTCLNIVPWDHRLLTTILKGQAVAGPQKKRGRGASLWEGLTVIRARVDRLESSGRYRELVRYLRAVASTDSVRLQELRDRVPFYLCKDGDFTSAANALLAPTSQACCPACRLTPTHFQNYLKMFWTGSVPTGNQLQGADQWVVSQGSLVKPWLLVTQALRVLYKNPSLYRDVESWGSLLALWGSSSDLGPSGLLTPLALQAPPPSFQMMVLTAADTILRDLRRQAVPSLPSRLFRGSLYREACMLLCVQATVQMLLAELPQLPPLLTLILALGENLWALELLLEGVLQGAPSMVDTLWRELSEHQCILLEAWRSLGPNYVGELLCLFLGSRTPELQALGISLTHLIARNLSQCPWAKLLDLHHLKTFKNPHMGVAEHLHLSQILAIIENM